MELKDIDIRCLKKYCKQIVVVEFPDKHCLTFLVSDVKSPLVPGYPACGLTYYNNVREARKVIKNLYEKLNYYPKNNVGFTSIFR